MIVLHNLTSISVRFALLKKYSLPEIRQVGKIPLKNANGDGFLVRLHSYGLAHHVKNANIFAGGGQSSKRLIIGNSNDICSMTAEGHLDKSDHSILQIRLAAMSVVPIGSLPKPLPKSTKCPRNAEVGMRWTPRSPDPPVRNIRVTIQKVVVTN